MKKRQLIFLAAALAAVTGGCRAPGEPRVCFHRADGQAVCVSVELAVSAEERSLGLMYRRALAPGRGMLFMFASDADHQFTMRNTSIPLSMIFIDRNKHVAGCIDLAAPMTAGPYAIGAASRYVLETHASFCGRTGLAPGDRAELINIPGLR